MKLFKALAFAGTLLGFATPTLASNPLWFGGEDTSMTAVGGAAYTSSPSAGVYNSTYSRAVFGAFNSTTVADPPGVRWTSPTFTPTSSIWVHAVFYSGAADATTSNQQALIIRSPDGVSRIQLRQTGTAGVLKLSIANAARSFTDLVTLSAYPFPTTLTTLDMQIPYTCGGGDVTNIYYNSVLAGTYTGSLCTDSATTLNQVEIASVNNGVGCAGGGFGTCWSQLLVDTVDTRSEVVATIIPQGAGPTQSWTPNTLANVNKGTISDTTFVSTTSNNAISQWTAPTSAPTGTWGVRAVSIEARALVSTTGPQNMEFSAHVSGSDYTSLCTNPTLTNSFANYRCQMNTSPATSSVWGISEIYNSGGNQFSFGVESLM